MVNQLVLTAMLRPHRGQVRDAGTAGASAGDRSSTVTLVRAVQREGLSPGLAPAAAAVACRGFAATSLIPIVDSHIHLFDPTRPEGIPWPEKSDTVLYQPALPARYKSVTEGLGIVGAIAVEASERKADNDWLLKTAQDNQIIVGIVGDLVPDTPDFGKDLERLHRSPLYLGIRYGNIWKRSLAADLDRPGFWDGLHLLAESGLVLESANPDATLLAALARVTERLPRLKIVVDHLPHAVIPTASAELASYDQSLKRLSASANVFVKLSEVPSKQNGVVATDISPYRDHLDQIWDRFGESRLIYGSDWPNSDHVLSFRPTFKLLEAYLQRKSQSARAQVYWRNSARAYGWKPRTADQPSLTP